MTWTPDADQRLLTLRQEHPEASASQLADLLYEQGIDKSKDAVQKRLRRMDPTALHDAMRKATYTAAARTLTEWGTKRKNPPVADEVGLSVPDAGKDFVGIRTIWWDLETTGLTGIMGRVLCCSFADSWGNVKTFRYEDYPGTSIIDDGPLCVAIRDELERAGHWVGWNSKLYDVPMLNARLLKAGERPLRKDILHTDLMYYARGQFVRIGSSKLVNVSEYIQSPHRKTPLEWATWQLAATGDRAAMDLVAEHCEADVLTTRDVFAVLVPHLTVIHR